MGMYSDVVMEHFMNPRNVGVIEDADGVGEVGNPVCGDMMTFYIKVKDERIEDVKFQTFGCGAAIAVSSMVSEMAKGRTLEEASAITNQSVAETLGGLPPNKMHCSNLGADALRKAIEDYRGRGEGGDSSKPAAGPPAREEHSDEECYCPYCDESLSEMVPHCKGCGRSLRFCPGCGKPQTGEARTCPDCGAEL